MKRLLLAIIVLGVMLWAVEIQMLGPVPWWVKDNNMSGNFRGICAVSDELVWAVGEGGAVYQRVGTVHQHEWQSVTIDVITQSQYHFNDVCFVDADHGWIVGEKNSGTDKYTGVIVWTDNGGAGWHLPTTMPSFDIPTPFLKVKMANVSRGYVSCGNGIILTTLDGGNSWAPTQSNPWDDEKNVEIWYNGLWVDSIEPQNLWVSGDALGTALQFDADGCKRIQTDELSVYICTNLSEFEDAQYLDNFNFCSVI